MHSDIRTHILNEARHIQPFDEIEQAHLTDITQWIQSGEPLFRIKKPDLPNKHLVSYFVLVDQKQRSILLVDHIKAQLWLPTGGHVKLNEKPHQTVVREAKEELNINAEFLFNKPRPFFATVTVTGGLTPGHTDVSFWYLLKSDVFSFINYDKREFTDIEWFTFDEILACDPVIFDPHLPRFVRKLQSYLS